MNTSLGKAVSHRWFDGLRYLLDILHVLRRTGAAPWLLLAGLSFIILLPQGREMLRWLGEDQSFGLWLANLGCLLGSSAILGLAVWYCSRALLAVRDSRNAAPLAQSPWLQTLREWLPRAMGTLAAAGVGISAVLVHAWLIAILNLGLAAALLCFFARRRTWFARLLRECDRAQVPEARAATLRSAPFVILLVSLLVSATLTCAFLVSPVRLPRVVGALAILQLALAAWVVFLNFAVLFLGYLLRLPALGAVMLAVLVAFSPFNDNHAIRRDAAAVSERTKLGDHFTAWAGRREAAVGQRLPVVIVAAEGGGVRAAYWTAGLLGAIAERSAARHGGAADSPFLRNLYAMSGVSGGAVGSSAFAAMIAQTEPGSLPGCMTDGKPASGWRACGVGLFGNDYLAPNLAALLYADLLQRFLPVGINAGDRALAMEYAAENDWGRLFPQHKDTLGRATQALWRDLPGSAATPALFINGTLAESGQRIIGSNVLIEGSNFPDAHDLYDVRGADAQQDRREMPLITAIHLSARFPFISPAGSFESGGQAFAHVVDGGYFENAGTATALDVLNGVIAAARELQRPLRPIVISIRNDPGEAGNCTQDLAEPRPLGKPIRWLSDLRIPQVGLYATRTARTGYTDGLIRDRVQTLRGIEAAQSGGDALVEPVYVRLCLPSDKDNENNPPLGWTLSRASQRYMDVSLERIARGEDLAVEALLDAVDGNNDKPVIAKAADEKLQAAIPRPSLSASQPRMTR
jgi:hypothetical protein